MRTVNPAFLGFNVSYFNDLGRFGITKHYIFWAVWVSLCSSDFSKSPYQPLTRRRPRGPRRLPCEVSAQKVSKVHNIRVRAYENTARTD